MGKSIVVRVGVALALALGNVYYLGRFAFLRFAALLFLYYNDLLLLGTTIRFTHNIFSLFRFLFIFDIFIIFNNRRRFFGGHGGLFDLARSPPWFLVGEFMCFLILPLNLESNFGLLECRDLLVRAGFLGGFGFLERFFILYGCLDVAAVVFRLLFNVSYGMARMGASSIQWKQFKGGYDLCPLIYSRRA